jgi:predicted transcriptional regulator of viral defense system
MVNQDYEPTEQEESVIELLKKERRVNPLRVRDVTGLGKQRVNDLLGNLVAAGWVRKVNQGLYEFVDDPRDT